MRQRMVKLDQIQRLAFASGYCFTAELPAFQTFLHQRFGTHKITALCINQRIVQLGVQVQRLVGRDGPSGGGPDGRKRFFVQCGQTERFGQFVGLGAQKRHIQGVAFFVGVFDFKLGQRRTAIETPIHRFEASVHKAALNHAFEGADFTGFVGRVHGAVGSLPVAQDT